MTADAVRLAGLMLAVACTGCTLNTDAAELSAQGRSEADGFGTLRVTLGDGLLSVRGREQSFVEATLRIEGLVREGDRRELEEQLSVGFEEQGQTLELVVSVPSRFRESLFIDALQGSAPSDLPLDLDNDDGDILVQDMRGPVRARTEGGTLRVSTAGSAQLRSERGAVRASIGEGGTIRTNAGEVDATVTGADFQSLLIATDEGDVLVTLPHGEGFDLELFTDDGNIDIDVEDRRLRNGGRFRGTLGGGGPLVQVESDTGDIVVRD